MCMGAGACLGAFVFHRNYFPGKRRMRQEMRTRAGWWGMNLFYHIWRRVIFEFLYIEFKGLYFLSMTRKYRRFPLRK